MPPSESRLTVLALERLLTFMYEGVCLQLIRITEFCRADRTLVRPFPRVNTQMTAEIRHLNELSFAMLALIRLLARVQPQMRLQVMVPRKPVKLRHHKDKSHTLCGYIVQCTRRSLSCISENIPFLAVWTLERLLAGMRTLVILQHVLVGEASVACPADE